MDAMTKVTDERAAAMEVVETALNVLAWRDQDHATSENGIGFSKFDGEFGHSLVDQLKQGRKLSPRQYHAALKMLGRYSRTQLAPAGIGLPTHEQLDADLEAAALSSRPVVAAQASQTSPLVKAAPAKAEPMQGTLKVVGQAIEWSIPQYDPNLVARVKAIGMGRYNGMTRAWSFPQEKAAALVAAFPGFIMDAALQQMAQAAQAASVVTTQQQTAQEAAAQQRLAKVLAKLGKLDRPLSNGRTMFKHQQAGVRRMIELICTTGMGPILADDMGLGKTMEALMTAKAFWKAEGTVTVVVAPASLRDNWLREASMVEVPIECYSWGKIPEPLAKPYILIGDEAHYAQSMKSKRTQAYLSLAKNAVAVISATGTPIKNGRPVNFYPLLVAAGHPLARNKTAYEKRYCGAGPTRFSQWDTTGATNLQELHERTKDIMLRRTKAECLDLPEKRRIFRAAEVSAQAKDQYEETLAQWRAEYEARVAKGEISDNGEALVVLTHLMRAGSIAKTDTTIALAEEVIEQGQQVVVFTKFKEAADKIASYFKCETLSGDTPTKERDPMVQRFQGGKTKVIVCTFGAGGVGVTLTAAQTVILNDRPWTPGDAVQAEDRLHRIGQQNSVDAYWVQYGDVDQKVDMVLVKKAVNIGKVLMGERKTMRGSGSIDAKAILKEVFS